MITRRQVVLALGAGALMAPLGAFGQKPAGKVFIIGILAIEKWPPIDSFRQAMQKLGYLEGQNVRYEIRYAEGRNERFAELATDLVSLKVDAILTWGTPAVLAAKRATTTIPIVMGAIGDAVGARVVSSLARPGGNITGNNALQAELEAKRIELLKEIVPTISRVTVLWNSTNSYTAIALQHAQAAAPKLKVTLSKHDAHDPTTLDNSLARLLKERPDAVIVLSDTFLVSQRRRIAQFALKQKLPSVYNFVEHVEAGGLVAYTPDYHALFRRAADYVDKILKGAKPGDIPIEQPTKFELVVNLKTAKSIGVKIPPSVLLRVDRVIE